ncbi:MAG TPA: hypothetical protein VIM11_02695 [Tepidisphaeraceae bacterium]
MYEIDLSVGRLKFHDPLPGPSTDFVVGSCRRLGKGGEVGAGEVGFAVFSQSTIRADSAGFWKGLVNPGVEFGREAGEKGVKRGGQADGVRQKTAVRREGPQRLKSGLG